MEKWYFLVLSALSIGFKLLPLIHKMHYFSDLFDKVLYTFRTGPLSIIRSISTQFELQLKEFLYLRSFYSLQEYF
jgi:hypothetical protein